MTAWSRQTAKFLAVLVKNMPEMSSDLMEAWIENPKALQNVLQNAFCSPAPNHASSKTRPQLQFGSWRTIRLGTHKRPNALSKALKNAGFQIGDYAAQILKKTTIATAETEIELVNVSGGQLGFENGATCDLICARAIKFGLDLVPAEVGPQLRLQYPGQPYGERLLIGMEPIENADGDPSVFGLGHFDNDRWLGTGCSAPDCFWIAEIRWVFARGKRN